MATLKVSEEQLRLIQHALDFYSRVGIGQFKVIKEHPTFEAHLHREFTVGIGALVQLVIQLYLYINEK